MQPKYSTPIDACERSCPGCANIRQHSRRPPLELNPLGCIATVFLSQKCPRLYIVLLRCSHCLFDDNQAAAVQLAVTISPRLGGELTCSSMQW